MIWWSGKQQDWLQTNLIIMYVVWYIPCANIKGLALREFLEKQNDTNVAIARSMRALIHLAFLFFFVLICTDTLLKYLMNKYISWRVAFIFLRVSCFSDFINMSVMYLKITLKSEIQYLSKYLHMPAKILHVVQIFLIG